MELYEFTRVLTTLCDFYERKEPKQATIELWFRLIKDIPSEPIPWILKKIQENHESFPKNMTAVFLSMFREWQQANPDKRAIRHFFECPDCDDGLIFAKRETNGVNYRYVFRCVKCRQDKTQAYPEASKLSLSQDYEILEARA